MLSSVTIKRFKSYREATLKLAPLTVMIGANASGKSNAIEALRLLSWIVQGNRLGSIRWMAQNGGRAMRGTVDDLGFRGATSFSLSCRASEKAWDSYAIKLEKWGEGELRIAGEELASQRFGFPLFRVESSSQTGGDMRVAYNNFMRGGKKPQVACNGQMAALTQLQSPAQFMRGHKKAQKTIPEAASQCQKLLAEMVFLDPQPAAMRGYSFRNEHVLTENGASLSGVLFDLCRKDRVKGQLLGFVEALPEQDISNIGFIETERGEVMVKLTESFGGKTTDYDATLLSDGTLRVLATAAAVLSAPEGSLVVIEEIDNGVHPSRAGHLLEQLSSIAERRKLCVLISSHNPALLDALPDDAVANVVFCYRHPKTGDSLLTRLEEIPDYPELIAQDTVGQLMTDGTIDRFLKNHPGPEEKRRRARAWLDELWQTAG